MPFTVYEFHTVEAILDPEPSHFRTYYLRYTLHSSVLCFIFLQQPALTARKPNHIFESSITLYSPHTCAKRHSIYDQAVFSLPSFRTTRPSQQEHTRSLQSDTSERIQWTLPILP